MLTKFEIKQLESNLKKVTGFDLMQRLQGRHRFQSCEDCAFCCRLCLNYKKKERNSTSLQVFLLNATLVRSILPIAAVPLCALGQNFLPKILFGFTFWEFMSRQTWVPFIRGIKVGLFLLFFLIGLDSFSLLRDKFALEFTHTYMVHCLVDKEELGCASTPCTP